MPSGAGLGVILCWPEAPPPGILSQRASRRASLWETRTRRLALSRRSVLLWPRPNEKRKGAKHQTNLVTNPGFETGDFTEGFDVPAAIPEFGSYLTVRFPTRFEHGQLRRGSLRQSRIL